MTDDEVLEFHDSILRLSPEDLAKSYEMTVEEAKKFKKTYSDAWHCFHLKRCGI